MDYHNILTFIVIVTLSIPVFAGDKHRKAKMLEEFAYHYYTSGDLDKAAKEYRNVLRKYPKSIKLHYNLGVIYTQNKKYGPAIKQFKIAIKDDSPIKKDALYNLTLIYGKYLKNEKKALHYHKQFKLLQDKKDKEEIIQGEEITQEDETK